MPSGVVPRPRASLEKQETDNRDNTTPLPRSEEIIHLSEILFVYNSKDEPTQGELQYQLFPKFCRAHRNTVGLPTLQSENKLAPTLFASSSTSESAWASFC